MLLLYYSEKRTLKFRLRFMNGSIGSSSRYSKPR